MCVELVVVMMVILLLRWQTDLCVLYINENSLVGEFGAIESSYITMLYFHCCDYTMTHTTYTKSVNLGAQIQKLSVQDGRTTSMSKITEVLTQNGKYKT